jgi:hypothetical protein
VSCEPDSLDASLSTRTFSSTDQLFEVGLFIAISGRLRAWGSQRESVSCEMPVSRATRRALSALLPVRRSIIFCLYGRENGLVTSRSLFCPAQNLSRQPTTTLALGVGQNCHLVTDLVISICHLCL